MKLINPTDDELDATFAEHVAGWKWRHEHGSHHFPTREMLCPPDWDGITMWREQVYKYGRGKPSPAGLITDKFNPMPRFTQSADAVLPWLEKYVWCADYDDPRFTGNRSYRVVIIVDGESSVSAVDKILSRAAVVCLLRANGHEVEFTK